MRFRSLAVGIVAALVGVSCSGASSPEFPDASDALGGVIYVDDGDARLDSGDQSVAGAVVYPLVGGGVEGQWVYAFDPNGVSTTTGSDGQFVIERGAGRTPAVQVRLEAPVEGDSAMGYLDYRVAVADSVENGIAVEPPQSCGSLDAPECGEVLLPDLVPIIEPGALAEDVQSALLNRPSGPAADDGSVEMESTELFPTQTWFIDESEGRRLLRFATVAANFGAGPLDVIATTSDTDSAKTWQRIWTDTNHYVDRSAGEFLNHPTHRHIHFDAFERYRLLAADGSIVAEAGKVSFCLRDSVLLSLEDRSERGVFPVEDCGPRQQAINPGYGDHYNQFLDDQWIDITDVEPGTYTVEITVDPLELLMESDETNNTGAFEVVID